MELAVDIGLGIVLLILVLIGAKRGIAKTALEFVAFAITLILAFYVCTPLAEGFYDSLMSEHTANKIAAELDKGEVFSDSVSLVKVGVPDFLAPFAKEQTQKLESLLRTAKNTSPSKAALASQIESNLVRPIAVKGISTIFFFLLCVVIGVVLHLLADTLSKLFHLPLMRTVDGTLGALFGALQGLVCVFVLMLLLLFLAPQIGGQFAFAVSSSKIIALIQSYFPSLTTF